MTTDPTNILVISGFAFAALLTMSLILLRGWRDWIQLKRAEIDAVMSEDRGSPAGGARIDGPATLKPGQAEIVVS